MVGLPRRTPALLAGPAAAPHRTSGLLAAVGAAPSWLPALLAGFVLTLPAWAPILLPDVDLVRLFDAEAHILKAFTLRQLITGGDWYPRWMPGYYGGYGYPTLTFYAPGLYYLLLLLAAPRPAGDLVFAFRAAGVLAALTLLSGVFALAWRLWRHGPAAVLCLALVAYAPVVLAGNLLGSGALPQLFGLGLTAWLLFCCLGLWQATAAGRPWGAWWWGTAGLSLGLLLTHNVSAAVAPVVLAGWLVVCWLAYPGWPALARTATAGALGGALGAFVWVPALLHAPQVQLERMHAATNHFRNWFLVWPGYHPELWGLPERSPWTPGWPVDLHLVYAHSLYGPPRAGLGQGLAILAGALALLAVSVRHRRGPAAGRSPGLLATAFGLLLAVGLYALCFDWFLVWWQRYPALRSIQFPYRLLGPVAIGAGLAGAGALALLTRPGARAWLLAAGLSLALAVSGTAGRSLPRSPGGSSVIDAASVLERQVSFPDFSASSGEFLPRTADYAERLDGEVRRFGLYEGMFPEAAWLAGRLLVWEGNVGVDAVSGGALWTAADVTVQGDGPGTLAFHQLLFPGWRAWVDGRAVAVRPPPWNPQQEISPGFLLVDVPPGRHQVAVRFGPSGPRLAGALLSLVATLGVGLALLLRRPRAAPWRPALGLTLCAAAAVCAWRLVAPLAPPAPLASGGAAPADVPPGALARGLAGAVLAGAAGVDSPSGAALGADRFVDVRYLTVRAGDRPLADAGPRSRRWLYAHPPAGVTLDVDVPADAYLQTGMALDPAAWEAPLGDGVEFTITLSPLAVEGKDVAPARSAGAVGAPPGGEPVVLLRSWLNPRARGEDRRWVDAVLDLRPWTGRRVRLTFRTTGRGDPAYDWGGWGEPAVVRLDPLTAARLRGSADATLRRSGRW
jgi:hypothetical protein